MATEGQYTYKYPHPSVTTDCVIFGYDGKVLSILLVERGNDPYKGCWALPGGFMEIDETVEECARRELLEETHLNLPKANHFEQFHTFSKVDRDPRERILSVAFFALVKPEDFEVAGGDDAAQARWFNQNELPRLAFDHSEIIRLAKERLRERVRTHPIAFKLLNQKFTMPELQNLYETILGVTYDRRNFSRKVRESGFLKQEGVSTEPQANRKPLLYSLDGDKVRAANESTTPGRFPFDF